MTQPSTSEKYPPIKPQNSLKANAAHTAMPPSEGYAVASSVVASPMGRLQQKGKIAWLMITGSGPTELITLSLP